MSLEQALCRQMKMVSFGAEDLDDFTQWFCEQAWPPDPNGDLRTLARHALGGLQDRTAQRTLVHLVDFLQGQAHRVPDALVGVTEAMLDQSYRQVLTLRSR
jgi:hypothetical protein